MKKPVFIQRLNLLHSEWSYTPTQTANANNIFRATTFSYLYFQSYRIAKVQQLNILFHLLLHCTFNNIAGGGGLGREGGGRLAEVRRRRANPITILKIENITSQRKTLGLVGQNILKIVIRDTKNCLLVRNHKLRCSLITPLQ